MCFLFDRGATVIYPKEKVLEAFDLKEAYPDAVLVAEYDGWKVDGAEYGNSPAEVEHADIAGRSVIMVTSAGTRGIVGSMHADTVITGSFVNVGAVISYIREVNPEVLSLLITDDRWDDAEDALCAKYIEDSVLGKQPDFLPIRNHLIAHPTSDGFITHPRTPESKKDFDLAMNIDRFPFIIQASYDNNMLVLRKTTVG
jgi:2-phosphosulfolactate phosphatase